METISQQEDPRRANALLTEEVQRLSQEIEAARERFTQQNRLAGIGQITAGILHEIRNPVNFVNNFSRLALDLVAEMKEMLEKMRTESASEDLDELDELAGMVETNLTRIYENGSRAERIAQSMLDQTRDDNRQLAPTDLNQMLEEFTKLAYQGVRAHDREFNVSFTFDLDPNVGHVNLMPNEFVRVIINLINNACYAVNEKRKAPPNPDYVPRITVRSVRHEGGIEIKIRDNGVGIPDELVNKVFNAFFTTKPPGEGTGLGLSLSLKTIVETHKGQLSVTTEPGEFTEFIIELPINLE
ncbi:sensor histidine kinase [Persicitalea sp.]|uniref:sensor histidine kinase n=1 Tax=Persicitalea sp. TaxID=3100273 RepID=UPI003592E8CF